MKKERKSKLVISLIFGLILILAQGTQLWAQGYDAPEVVRVMRQNQVQLREAERAVDKGDFFATASAFYTIAEGMNGIKRFTPTKGNKAAWDKTMEAIVTAAFRGIGACAEKDAAGVKRQIAALQALERSGHSEHR